MLPEIPANPFFISRRLARISFGDEPVRRVKEILPHFRTPGPESERDRLLCGGPEFSAAVQGGHGLHQRRYGSCRFQDS